MTLFDREKARHREDFVAGRWYPCATSLIYTVLNRYARRFGSLDDAAGSKLFYKLAAKYSKYPEMVTRNIPQPATWPRAERKRWHANSKR